MYTRTFLFLLLGFLFVACSDSESDDEKIDLGYSYFPTQTGATWIYKVDSLVYDDNSGQTTIDTFAFEYKEQLTQSFKDVTGDSAQQVNRYFRYNDSMPWVALNSWTQTRTALNAQRVEENTRFVKLVFPLSKNKSWNGNMYNRLDSIPFYKISYLDEPSKVGNSTYAQTVKVVKQNEVNAIQEIVRYEIYARNIGLIYSLSDSLNTQLSGSRGYRYRFTLTSYTP